MPAGSAYLARSPGGTATWDNIAFINCRMDTHIAAAGWAGLGVNGQPAPNPTVLSEAEVANRFATRAKVFAGYGSGMGWNPQP